MDIKTALAWGRRYLSYCGVANPFLDAEILLAHCTGLDRAGLYRESDRSLNNAERKTFCLLILRRAQKEPVAYLTGKKEFMGLEFEVDPSVLIPRPETEVLVEKTLELAKELPFRPFEIADVGTGSGAIAISLAKYLPEAKIYATDVSSCALKIARKNAQKHRVEGKIIFLEGNLLLPLFEQGVKGEINLIVANLPYIPIPELTNLIPDVRLYEPLYALDGGTDGLIHYRRLIPQAKELLSSPGYLIMEIGEGQGEEIGRLLKKNGWHYIIIKDFRNKDRVVVAFIK